MVREPTFWPTQSFDSSAFPPTLKATAMHRQRGETLLSQFGDPLLGGLVSAQCGSDSRANLRLVSKSTRDQVDYSSPYRGVYGGGDPVVDALRSLPRLARLSVKRFKLMAGARRCCHVPAAPAPQGGVARPGPCRPCQSCCSSSNCWQSSKAWRRCSPSQGPGCTGRTSQSPTRGCWRRRRGSSSCRACSGSSSGADAFNHLLGASTAAIPARTSAAAAAPSSAPALCTAAVPAMHLRVVARGGPGDCEG